MSDFFENACFSYKIPNNYSLQPANCSISISGFYFSELQANSNFSAHTLRGNMDQIVIIGLLSQLNIYNMNVAPKIDLALLLFTSYL